MQNGLLPPAPVSLMTEGGVVPWAAMNDPLTVAWFDAATTGTVGASIRTWAPKAGTALNSLTASAPAAPTLVNDTDGAKGLSFANGVGLMTSPDATDWTWIGQGDHSSLTIFRCSTKAASNIIWKAGYLHGQSNLIWTYSVGSQGGVQVQLRNGSNAMIAAKTIAHVANNGELVAVVVRYHNGGTSSDLQVDCNGVSLGTAATGNAPGGTAADRGLSFNGDTLPSGGCEIIAHFTAKTCWTDAQFASLMALARDTYGVQPMVRAPAAALGYEAFPHPIMSSSGVYLCATRGGTVHVGPTDLGVIYLRSSADALNWSAPRTILSDPAWDLRDPCLFKTATGTLVLTFFKLNPANENQDFAGVSRSTDGGATWSTPTYAPLGTADWVCSSAPVVQLANGRLLWSCYASRSSLNIGASYNLVYSSDDDGVTWSLLSTFAATPGVSYSEPNILVLSDKIIALYRTSSTTYISTSTDSGATWTAPASVFGGSCSPHLIQLASGRILCSTGGSLAGRRAAFFYSDDSGSTWSPECWADSDVPPTCMYGGAVEVSPGVVAATFAKQYGSTNCTLTARKYPEGFFGLTP